MVVDKIVAYKMVADIVAYKTVYRQYGTGNVVATFFRDFNSIVFNLN